MPSGPVSDIVDGIDVALQTFNTRQAFRLPDERHEIVRTGKRGHGLQRIVDDGIILIDIEMGAEKVLLSSTGESQEQGEKR